MIRRDLFRLCNVIALREHGCDASDLHVAEAGEGADTPLEVSTVCGVRPDARRVAVVLGGDECGEILDALRHCTGEAMHRGLLSEDRLEVGAREPCGLERAQSLLDAQRSEERLLHGDLLV